MNFPCGMYHAEHGAKIFYAEDEFREAGHGWADNPEKALELLSPPNKVGEPYTTTKRVKR